MDENILSSRLLSVLKGLGFEDLTEIQKLAIPKINSGQNIVVSAPTGYGKTLAAFLPFLDRLDSKAPGIQLLYITPLKSLNRDIFKNIIKIGEKMSIEIDVRHGDTSAYERANQARMPPHCLITTPETLQSVFLSQRMRDNLKNLKGVIIDEIQGLMESKRGTQFSVGFERLKSLAKFQTVGISATIADFEETKKFISASDAIQFYGSKKYDVEVVYPNISKEDEAVASNEKVTDVIANGLKYIKNAIKDSKSTLLFTNTRETAEFLGSRLTKFIKNEKVEVHHSSLSKEVRTQIEEAFKVGSVKLMIATSSMELGIDIGDVDLVIQYMSPRQVIKMIQRIGRSNHNKEGVAKGKILTINVDDYLESMAIQHCISEKKLEIIPVPKNSLDILAHQIVGLIIDGVRTEDGIYETIKKSYAFDSLDKTEFKNVLDFLLKHYMIRYYGTELIRTRKGLLFYIGNISSIPDKRTYIVIDSQLNQRVGVLDEGFVAEHARENSNFIMKGETWKIVKIENGKISVVRSPGSIGSIPAWEGELMPVSRFVAEKAADLRKDYVKKFSALSEQKDSFSMPDKETILLEKIEDFVIMHSTFGSKINEGISKAIAAVITEVTGESVMAKIDPYRIMVKTKLSLDGFRKVLLNIKDVEELVRKSTFNSTLFEYRFLNVAKRFGIINKNTDFTKMRIRGLIDIYRGSVIEHETYNEIFADKIDIKGTTEIVMRLKNGDIKLDINDGDPSPLAYEGLESSYGGSLVKPEEARKLLRDLVLERLKSTPFCMVCMNCGKSLGELHADNTDGLKCPKCTAKYIGFYKAKYKDEYAPIIKKYFAKKELSKQEELIIKGVKQSGSLYLGYGKKACIVGASYGVGPTTASRILSSYSRTEEELIEKIIEAEKNYIETREYWG